MPLQSLMKYLMVRLPLCFLHLRRALDQSFAVAKIRRRLVQRIGEIFGALKQYVW